MKFLNKRIISLLLALVMICGMMPMTAFATEGSQETEAVEVVTEPSEPSESEEEPEVIHEHDYEAVVTDPTCMEQGYTTYTCACGDSYESDYVDARGYDWMLEDGEFKILLIGNSFSEDASNAGMPNSQMLDILQAMLGEDVPVTVGLCYSGGKGLNWHATQSEQGNSSYSLRVISTESGKWRSYGSYTSANALTWADWDVVSLQHYEINTTTGKESNAYSDQVDPKFDDLESATEFMLDYVDQYAPDAAVYFYMHWARAYKPNLNESLATYNKMADFFPRVLDYTGTDSANRFETIIPVGLAVQNARTTYLATLAYNTTAYADKTLNLQTDAQIGLQRDTGHLSYNIGRYLAAMTFAETVIPKELRTDGYVLPDIRVTESIGELPKEYTVVVQKAVKAAVDSWKKGSLAVTDVEGYRLDPAVAESEKLEGVSLELPYGNADALAAQISSEILARLPADFEVSKVDIDETAMTADVTIRFGYTSAMFTVSYAVFGPVITRQPESVEQEVGKKFAITVKAEGEGLTYQWYYKDSGMKSFGVSSNKTASYAYTMMAYMHDRQVYCVITDASGNSVQTETATITRPPQALKILEQPKDAQQEIGQKFSISPKVEGDGLTYQWYVKESGAKAFKVSSNKTASYAYTMQSYMKGRQVYCVITDKYGNSVTTDVATISLPPVELKILQQPTDVYASKGEKFSISPKVQGEGLTYQWYYKEGYMKDFKLSSNKTSAYAYSMQTYMNERSVYCVITDKYGNQVVTEAVTIHLEK